MIIMNVSEASSCLSLAGLGVLMVIAVVVVEVEVAYFHATSLVRPFFYHFNSHKLLLHTF